MAKFKVGDRVTANGNVGGICGPGTIVEIDEGHRTNEYRVRFDSHPHNIIWAYNHTVRPLASEDKKILITTDGKTTLARLYEKQRDGYEKLLKTAEAKCAPSDTFDFATGANLAYNRLMFGTDYHPSEVTLKPKAEDKPAPVKLYCVKSDPGWLTRGKVYTFDGHCVNYDEGGCFRADNFEDWKRGDSGLAECLYPLVSRPAKVGEWVYMEKDILGFVSDCCRLSFVKQSDENGRIYNRNGRTMTPNHYLVLDGYDGRYEEKPAKEMTVAEIEKALGYSVKVVKGEARHD